MEYDGTSEEVVWSGCWKNNGSKIGSGAATGAGAGAGDGFLVTFFFGFFFPPAAAPAPPPMQRQQASRRSHCQICMKDPEEPDAVEPELEPELDLPIDALEESFLKELE
jgi:hypothetical protein